MCIFISKPVFYRSYRKNFVLLYIISIRSYRGLNKVVSLRLSAKKLELLENNLILRFSHINSSLIESYGAGFIE